MHKSIPKPEPYKLTQPFSLNIPRCRHLKVNGTQCGSPALKDHRFCYSHQQWHERKLVINSPRARKARATISLPVLEDANAIQLSVMQIMQLLLEGQIEQKTAGLLFYGLQIASSNLKHTNFEPETKNEIVIDPQENRGNPPRPAALEERRFRRNPRRQNQPRRLRPDRSNHPRHRPDEKAVRHGAHAAICPRALRPLDPAQTGQR